MKRPAVLVVTRKTLRNKKYIDYVGEFHLALLVRLKTLPVLLNGLIRQKAAQTRDQALPTRFQPQPQSARNNACRAFSSN